MDMKITEAEIKGALDYWLRQTHPTVMEGREIARMTIEQYPATITLSIEAPKLGELGPPVPAEPSKYAMVG